MTAKRCNLILIIYFHEIVILTTGAKNVVYTIYGEKCIFPFTYKKKKRSSCIIDKINPGSAWCPTEIEGKEIKKRGKCIADFGKNISKL